MMNLINQILSDLDKTEKRIQSGSANPIEESNQMRNYLKDLLHSLKNKILSKGFRNVDEEIYFFREAKPKILGKLIFYNKVYLIESACPVSSGKIYTRYFTEQLKILKQDYSQYICNADFYRYYRSGRIDKDDDYFRLGKINYDDALSSFVFEIDPEFSTYYDFKVARIICNELLYNYLIGKIDPKDNPDSIIVSNGSSSDVFWTDSKNALIELIYALHATESISHGKIGIRKISMVFQILFRVQISDLHNAFHRMKSRSGSRTTFLDNLKSSLEEYMDQD